MKKTLACLAACAAVFGATQAQAAHKGPYVSVSAANTTAVGFEDTMNDIGPGLAVSADEKATGFAISGGYRFGEHFAIEGGFTRIGKVEAAFSDSRFNMTAQYEANMIGADAVLIYPFNDAFEVYGKAGFGVVFVDEEVNSNFGSGTSESVYLAPKLGVGASCWFTDNISASIEYQRVFYSAVADADIDIDIASVSLRYAF